MLIKFLLKCYVFTALAFSSVYFTAAQSISVTLGQPNSIPADYFGYNGANLNRPGQPDFDTPWLIDSMTSIFPTSVRYPGGYLCNYWDWQQGYLKKDLPEGWVVWDDYGSVSKNNTLLKLRAMVNQNALAPMISLNILSSTKEYQTAALLYGTGINLPVKNIELGNELYRDYPEFSSVFPNAESYVTKSNEWASYIKSMPGFSNHKIGIIGGTKRSSEPDYSRGNSWTEKVASLANNSVDAIILHYYIGCGFQKEVESEARLSLMLSNPFSQYLRTKPEIDLIKAAGKEVWITEYNLFDRAHCVHDTWAHGLFLATQTMTMLEDTAITKVFCHSLTADARFSSFFNDSAALIDYNNFIGDANCNIGAPLTRAHQMSANGTALSKVAHALQNSTSRKPLVFGNGTPVFENGYQRLYGWYFDGPLYTEVIILNLDSISHTINISNSVWNLNGAKYEQIYCGPGGPLDFIVGNPKTNPGAHEIAILANQNASQNTLLRKWSLTRIWKTKTAIIAKATDSEICKGTKTTLVARGGSNYTWSGANFTYLKPDGSLVEFNLNNTTVKTYNITVTDASGATATATVKISAKPTLSISSSATSICRGDSISLNATLSGGNSANTSSFIWVPSESIANPNQAACVAYPGKSTVYTVYATDGRCYSNYDSIAVTIGPVAHAGEDRLIAINQLPFTILTAQSTQPGINYDWSQNQTFIGTGINLNVTPNVTTTYTLIVSDASNSACRDSDQVTITPIITCESSVDTALTIPPYYTMKQFIKRLTDYCTATGVGSIDASSLKNFNRQIVFNGPFFVDCGFSFINCGNLQFSEGAYIIQNVNNKSLSFDNCSLTAATCSGKMWRGLVVEEYGEKLTINNCFIQDAIIGVDAFNNSNIFVSNTQFDRCNIGLHFSKFTDPAGDITGCSFTGVKLTKAPYLNRTRFAGISCENVLSISVGDSTAPGNFFENSKFGIYAMNTSVNSYNNTFNLMKSTLSTLNSGTGIYVFNSKGQGNINDNAQLWPIYYLNAGKTDHNAKNTFSNSPKGILVENGGAVILGNSFNAVNTAVKITGSIYKNIDLNDNTITGTNMGFDLNNNKFASIDLYRNNVTTNNATTTSTNKFCFHINDAAGMSSVLKIRDNILTNKGLHGIWVTNNNDLIIQDNTIYMNQTTNLPCYGIRLENCDFPEISCNLIRGNSTSIYSMKKAISLSYSPESDILCNTTDKTGTGMEFIADCNLATLKTNILQHHDDGLVIGADGLSGGVIGPQPLLTSFLKSNGNIFEGQYTIASGAGKGKGYFAHAATYSVNSLAGGLLGTLNQFVVYSGDSLQIPYKNLKTGLTSIPLIPNYNIRIPNACVSNCDNPNPAKTATETISESDLISMKDKLAMRINDLSNNEATTYSLKSNLLKSIDLSDFTTNIDHNNLEQFYNASFNSNAGKIIEIEKNYAALKNSIGLSNNNIEDKLNEAAHLTEAIDPQSVFELNRKEVEQIKLNMLLSKKKSYSDEDIAMIKSIAEQCPYVGGNAVFEARGIYALWYPEVYFNDENLCNSKVDHELLSSDENEIYFKAFPNPANETLNFSYNLAQYNNCQIEFYDLTGRVVMKIILNTNSNFKTIETWNLENGLYNYRVNADGEQVNQGKISIIK